MRKLVLTLILTLLLTGCGAPVGRTLGTVFDFEYDVAGPHPPTRIWADDLTELQDILVALDAAEFSQELAEIDLAGEVVVSVSFNACNRGDPGLILQGTTLLVRFGRMEDHDCVREVPTLSVFAVPRAELPDLATVQLRVER